MSNDFKDLFGDWRPDDESAGVDEDAPEKLPHHRGDRALNEKEVRVINVFEATGEGVDGQPVSTTFVLLRDNLGRKIKIFIGRDVAFAISMGLERHAPDRPFTHDLIRVIIERLGASVESVTIDDLMQETFYAKITLSYQNTLREIDARPSDALALALRCKAPIYVAEAVLEAAQDD